MRFLPVWMVIVCLCLGCAEEKKLLVVPVAGISPDYQTAKEEQIRLLAADFPKLKQNALDAILSIPRMFFVTAEARHRAYLIKTYRNRDGSEKRIYDDKALPIGSGQSMLKLSDVGFLLSELDIQPTDNILEVGSGNGYLTAILSRLGAHVYGMEINERLSEIAVQTLQRMKIIEDRKDNGDDGQAGSDSASKQMGEHVRICCGDGLPNELPELLPEYAELYQKMACRKDGLYGLIVYAPYDVVLITASVSLERPVVKTVESQSASAEHQIQENTPFTIEERLETLLTQLKPGGRIAVPVLDNNGDSVWHVYHWRDGQLEETASRPTAIKQALSLVNSHK